MAIQKRFTPNTEETRKAAADLFKALEPIMANLAGRWADESQYEDINDYKAVLDPHVIAAGGQILRMFKRPFGFRFCLNGSLYDVKMAMRSYSYQRVG